MEFTLKDIYALIDKVQSSDLTSFAYRDAQSEIQMERGSAGHSRIAAAGSMVSAAEIPVNAPQNPGDAAVPEAPANMVVMTSPMVGTFYAAPSEDEEPYVAAGNAVQKGQTLCIVEAMKLMNEVESEYDGVVREILVKNGQMVEYGQPLFRIEKRG